MIKQHRPNKMTTNAKVTSTRVTQPGNEILGTKDKALYYLIIENEHGRVVINVGEKTETAVRKITEKPTADPIQDARARAAAQKEVKK